MNRNVFFAAAVTAATLASPLAGARDIDQLQWGAFFANAGTCGVDARCATAYATQSRYHPTGEWLTEVGVQVTDRRSDGGVDVKDIRCVLKTPGLMNARRSGLDFTAKLDPAMAECDASLTTQMSNGTQTQAPLAEAMTVKVSMRNPAQTETFTEGDLPQVGLVCSAFWAYAPVTTITVNGQSMPASQNDENLWNVYNCVFDTAINP